MKKIYLCGHTGSTNRGCEAIISSTVDILAGLGETDVTLLSFNKQADVSVGLDKKVGIISPPKKSIFAKGKSFIKRKLSIKGAKDFEYLYKEVMKIADGETVIFNVGDGGTHSMSSLNLAPKGIRKVLDLETYETEFPLNHPPYVMEEVDYKEKYLRVMGWGHPWVTFYRRCEATLLAIRYGDKNSLKRKIKKLFRHKNK